MILPKPDDPVVSLQDVVVDYGRFRALHGVTLSLPKGATGLVGRNGAGKSTLLRLLLGLIRPTSGGGSVLGRDLKTPGAVLRQQVGFMPENDALVPGMKGWSRLCSPANSAGSPLRRPLAEPTKSSHTPNWARPATARWSSIPRACGRGSSSRSPLCTTRSFCCWTKPTVGLDPPGRKQMLDLVGDLVQRHSKSIILCTHLLGDIEHTCEHVAMIDSGRVLRSGRITDLNAAPTSSFRILWEGPNEPFLRRLQIDGVQLQKEPTPGGRTTAALDHAGERVAAARLRLAKAVRPREGGRRAAVGTSA